MKHEARVFDMASQTSVRIERNCDCLFLIRGKLNECHAGGFFSRLTLRRVMGVESGSERFRVPKTSFQENVLVNDAVPALTKYKNKWAVSIFAEWQRSKFRY